MELNMMKIKTVLSALIAGILAIISSACQLGSDVEITKAEYTNKNSFTVYYIGKPEYSVNFNVDGKDKRYTVSSSASVTVIDTKVVCRTDGRFISGDHITVTSGELPGSAEFDVPDYSE
jgi:hypothetical protein